MCCILPGRPKHASPPPPDPAEESPTGLDDLLSVRAAALASTPPLHPCGHTPGVPSAEQPPSSSVAPAAPAGGTSKKISYRSNWVDHGESAACTITPSVLANAEISLPSFVRKMMEGLAVRETITLHTPAGSHSIELYLRCACDGTARVDVGGMLPGQL
jgi:hypothetical protein